MINIKKTEFMQKSLNYLGFNINEDGYSPDLSRLENFESWEKPKTIVQLQKMLGKINWYRFFLKDISTLLVPLYSHLKKRGNNTTRINVTDREMEIVHNIYHKLKDNARLYFPDLNKPFYLQTDACDIGIGGVLYQSNSIIGYYSKKLSGATPNYCTTEKEMYAVLKCVQHWRSWIGGSKIFIKTDSKIY
jgi:hypothetical protein